MGNCSCCGACSKQIEKIVVKYGDISKEFIINSSIAKDVIISLPFGDVSKYYRPGPGDGTGANFLRPYEEVSFRDYKVTITCPPDADPKSFSLVEKSNLVNVEYTNNSVIFYLPDQRIINELDFNGQVGNGKGSKYLAINTGVSFQPKIYPFYSDYNMVYLSPQFKYPYQRTDKELEDEIFSSGFIDLGYSIKIERNDISVDNSIGPLRYFSEHLTPFSTVGKTVITSRISDTATSCQEFISSRHDITGDGELVSEQRIHEMKGLFITLKCSDDENFVDVKIHNHFSTDYNYALGSVRVDSTYYSFPDFFQTNYYNFRYYVLGNNDPSNYSGFAITSLYTGGECDLTQIPDLSTFTPPPNQIYFQCETCPPGTSSDCNSGIVGSAGCLTQHEAMPIHYIANYTGIYSENINFNDNVFNISNYNNNSTYTTSIFYQDISDEIKTKKYTFNNPVKNKNDQLSSFDTIYDKDNYSDRFSSCYHPEDNIVSLKYLYYFPEIPHDFRYYYPGLTLARCTHGNRPPEELRSLDIEIHYSGGQSSKCYSKIFNDLQEKISNKSIDISKVVITDNETATFYTNPISTRTVKNIISLDKNVDRQSILLSDGDQTGDIESIQNLISVCNKSKPSKSDRVNKYINWDVDFISRYGPSLIPANYGTPVLHSRLSSTMPHGRDNKWNITRKENQLTYSDGFLSNLIILRSDYGNIEIDIYFYIIDSKLKMLIGLSMYKKKDVERYRYVTGNEIILNSSDRNVCDRPPVSNFCGITPNCSRVSYGYKKTYIYDDTQHGDIFYSNLLDIDTIDDLYKPIRIDYFQYTDASSGHYVVELFPE